MWPGCLTVTSKCYLFLALTECPITIVSSANPGSEFLSTTTSLDVFFPYPIRSKSGLLATVIDIFTESRIGSNIQFF